MIKKITADEEYRDLLAEAEQIFNNADAYVPEEALLAAWKNKCGFSLKHLGTVMSMNDNRKPVIKIDY